MRARLWVPSPLRGEGQDEGKVKRCFPFFFSTLTLALSLEGRGKDKGGTLFTDKVCAEHCFLFLTKGEKV
jgi:hypothetical protein